MSVSTPVSVTAPPRRHRVDRNEVLALVGVTAVAFGAAALFLGRREFWLDESFSYLVTRRSWSELVDFSFRRDGELNMALYYALLKPFADTSASSSLLRLPSFIPMVVTTPIVWLIADRVDGRRFVRVAAVALYLTHPLVVSYAFEARAYGMLTLLTASLTLLLIVALGGSKPAAAAYAVVLAVSIGVHFLIVFVAVAHVVGILIVAPGSIGRRAVRAAWLAGPALVVAALASALVFRFQGNLANDEPLSLRDVLAGVYAASGRAGPLTLLVIAATAAGVVAIARAGRRSLGWVLVVTIAVPPVLALVASLQRPVFSSRYLVHLVPVMGCVVAIGLAAVFAERRNRVAALAAFLVLGVVGQSVIYWSPDEEQPVSASVYVLDRARAGDVIAFNGPNAQLPFQHHLDETGRTGPLQVDLMADPALPTRMIEREPLARAAAVLEPGASAWILENHPNPQRSVELRDALLDVGLRLDERTEFADVAVERWSRS